MHERDFSNHHRLILLSFFAIAIGAVSSLSARERVV
jgi:hypothetical protein